LIVWLFDWLVIYCFTPCSRISHLQGAKRSHMLGAQGLWAAIVPLQLWHRASVFPVSTEGPHHSFVFLWYTGGCEGSILTRILTGSHSVASYDRQGNAE
jgi:hypothetical protein